MSDCTELRKDVLIKAAIDYVKSLIEFNLKQKQGKIFVEVKIDDEILLNIDLDSIKDFNNMYLGDCEMLINQEENK